MYAQVDKKKSKEKEVSEDPSCESGDVYSVVNKPSVPEIPQKSELFLEELTKTNIPSIQIVSTSLFRYGNIIIRLYVVLQVFHGYIKKICI